MEAFAGGPSEGVRLMPSEISTEATRRGLSGSSLGPVRGDQRWTQSMTSLLTTRRKSSLMIDLESKRSSSKLRRTPGRLSTGASFRKRSKSRTQTGACSRAWKRAAEQSKAEHFGRRGSQRPIQPPPRKPKAAACSASRRPAGRPHRQRSQRTPSKSRTCDSTTPRLVADGLRRVIRSVRASRSFCVVAGATVEVARLRAVGGQRAGARR